MDHLSSSQMNLYFQCSLKYKFQYIDGLPKPFKASGLVFGGAIHTAISWFHKKQLAGRNVPLEKLYAIFSADWYGQKVESDIRYREGETETSQILLGKEILGLYYHQPRKQVKGTEIPFTVPLVSPGNGTTWASIWRATLTSLRKMTASWSSKPRSGPWISKI